jgi:hypothetical protein
VELPLLVVAAVSWSIQSSTPAPPAHDRPAGTISAYPACRASQKLPSHSRYPVILSLASEWSGVERHRRVLTDRRARPGRRRPLAPEVAVTPRRLGRETGRYDVEWRSARTLPTGRSPPRPPALSSRCSRTHARTEGTGTRTASALASGIAVRARGGRADTRRPARRPGGGGCSDARAHAQRWERQRRAAKDGIGRRNAATTTGTRAGTITRWDGGAPEVDETKN